MWPSGSSLGRSRGPDCGNGASPPECKEIPAVAILGLSPWCRSLTKVCNKSEQPQDCTPRDRRRGDIMTVGT